MSHADPDLRFKSILPGIFVFLVLSLGPTIIAWFLAPTGTTFIGTLANHNDFTAYIAAMRQGAEGRWLFHFNFSPEFWSPQLMLPLYILAGKLLHPLSNNYFFWFNVLRAGAIIFTLTAFLFWVRQVYPQNRRLQLLAWVLITFGGGLGWLLWPIANALNLQTDFTYFPDLGLPEWTTLLVSINAPHYLFGMGLQAILFGCIIRMARAVSGWKWALVGMIVALSLALVYVYHTAVAGFVIGLYLLLLAWRARRIPWKLWLQAALVITPLLPLLFYYGYWVNRDPAWATYVNSDLNNIAPPPLPGLLIGFGLLFILALAATRGWLHTKKEMLPIVWIGGAIFLLYIPIIHYSGRFALGLIVPVATLAACGLEEVVLPWLHTTRFYRRFTAFTATPEASLRRILLMFMLPSALMVSLTLVKNVLTISDFPYFLPQAEWQATSWLANHTDEDNVVLANYPISNLLPALGNTRVFAGQFFLTLHFEEKMAQVEKFWTATTPDEWRQALITEWGITHVYQGRYENNLMQEPFMLPGRVIYDVNGIVIYQVNEDIE